MDLHSPAQHVHKRGIWSWESEITPLAALPKAVLINPFVFLLQYQIYCSREKGEPSYDK